MKNRLVLGDWNAICDVCGFKFKASQMKKRWDGLMVCHSDYELRNPQDFLRLPKEQINTPWSRPEHTDVFLTDNVLTESGDNVITESGDYVITE